jgi:hypothetical protein
MRILPYGLAVFVGAAGLRQALGEKGGPALNKAVLVDSMRGARAG